MVVFTCQNCNESLKRTAVEKHYSTKCKKAPFLTCIDCLQDFRDDFNEHTSCVTEEERYGAKGVQVKPAGVKQNSWLQVVHHVANKYHNSELSQFLSKLLLYQNVPRNEKKFLNFAKASLGCHDAKKASHIFLMIQSEFKKNSSDSSHVNDKTANNNCNGNSSEEKQSDKKKTENQNGIDSISENKKSKKKRNLNSECSEVSVNGEELAEDLGKEASPTLNNSRNKKPKKKKMKKSEQSEETGTEENGGEEAGREDAGTKSKKKKKNKNRKSTEVGEDENEETIGEVNGKNKKKKNGKLSGSEEVEGGNEEVHNGTDKKDDNGDVLEEVVPVKGDPQVEKLSKKELKKLRKKEKYEAECKLIAETAAAAAAENEEETGDVEGEGEKKTGKEGKSKKNKSLVTAEEEATQVKGSNKFKKRKAACEGEQGDKEKRPKIQDEEIETSNAAEDDAGTTTAKKSEKFDWEIVVKELLRKSSDQELAIKRLSKKVLAEYQSVKGDRESYEELMTKFNKKIKKIPGIRLLKDKVKLIG